MFQQLSTFSKNCSTTKQWSRMYMILPPPLFAFEKLIYIKEKNDYAENMLKDELSPASSSLEFPQA